MRSTADGVTVRLYHLSEAEDGGARTLMYGPLHEGGDPWEREPRALSSLPKVAMIRHGGSDHSRDGGTPPCRAGLSGHPRWPRNGGSA